MAETVCSLSRPQRSTSAARRAAWRDGVQHVWAW